MRGSIHSLTLLPSYRTHEGTRAANGGLADEGQPYLVHFRYLRARNASTYYKSHASASQKEVHVREWNRRRDVALRDGHFTEPETGLARLVIPLLTGLAATWCGEPSSRWRALPEHVHQWCATASAYAGRSAVVLATVGQTASTSIGDALFGSQHDFDYWSEPCRRCSDSGREGHGLRSSSCRHTPVAIWSRGCCLVK